MERILPKNAKLVPKQADLVFSGEIFHIYQWQQKMYDGSFATFEMAKRSDTVQVLGFVGEKLIVLNEEQPDGTKRSFGLPGGRIDESDSSPQEAAKREMVEETGYSFKNWKLLNVYQPQQKIEWFIYFFVAWDPSDPVKQKIDKGEMIEVKNISWNEYLSKGYSQTIFEKNLLKYRNVQQLITAPEYKK